MGEGIQPPRLVPDSGSLLESLLVAPPDLFNQYATADSALDLPDAPQRRLENLGRYLRAFSRARWLLVGEAAGFRACRFTGVPFTDETQLVGPRQLGWAGQANGFRRTSQPERPLLREASATVVWAALGERRDVALWNVVPWHPPGRRGPLSNALPSRAARRAGLAVLKLALEVVWPDARPLAVGRVAERALRELGIAGPLYLRHPGHGGNVAFTGGLLDLLAHRPLETDEGPPVLDQPTENSAPARLSDPRVSPSIASSQSSVVG